jgi:hypothetical protein
LLIGLIAIFIAEHMDHSFRDDDDLSAFTNQPVLSTIPRFALEADAVRRANIIKLLVGAGAALGFLMLIFLILRLGFGINLLKVIHR